MEETRFKRLIDRIAILPLSIILFLVPLVVSISEHRLGSIEKAFWKFQDLHTDFYSYSKMIVFLILAMFSIVLFAIYTKQNKRKLVVDDIYIPMVIYGFFIVLSTAGSAYMEIALRGFADRYEGMFVILCYLLVSFIAINMIDGESSVKKLIYPLMVSAVLIGIIGVFEYMGYGILETAFGKRIILNTRYTEMADRISFRFGKGTISSTLYNPNYVGSYTVMLISVAGTYTLMLREKKKRFLFGMVSILMLATLLGSNSRGGFLGAIVVLVLGAVLFRRLIGKNLRVIGLGVLFLVGISLAMNSISGGRVFGQITRLGSDMMTVFKSQPELEDEEYMAKELTAEGSTLKFVTNRETILFKYDDGKIDLEDETGEEIAYLVDAETGVLTLEDDRYDNYQIGFFKDDYSFYVEMLVNETRGWFTIENGEFRNYHGVGIITDIEEVKSVGFKGNERVGSNRGYIWSRSIPLLRETILRGYGPDAYVIYFPQKDFVGSFNTGVYGDSVVVDKPHNLYLQIGLNTGILSLLAFLWIMGIYILQSWKVYYRSNFDTFISATGVGIFLAVAGYLVAGVFNDSVLGVAPVFWILLGMGVGINNWIKKGKDRVEVLEEQSLEID